MTLKDDFDKLDAAWADFKRALWEHRWSLFLNMVAAWLAFLAGYLLAAGLR